MYTVKCKNCGKDYSSKVNRSGLCADCKTTARSKTNTKYRDSSYEQIMFYVPKGQKAKIKKHAEILGLSVNEICKKGLWLFLEQEYKRQGIDPENPEKKSES